jgi:hypothetical protein
MRFLLVFTLALPSCGLLGGYDDLAPGAQSMHAIATVHAQELQALAVDLEDREPITAEQAAKLAASAEEAADLAKQTAEFLRLVRGEAQQ